VTVPELQANYQTPDKTAPIRIYRSPLAIKRPNLPTLSPNNGIADTEGSSVGRRRGGSLREEIIENVREEMRV
jgi:hypothetical protein